jgi:hypothetical protein
MEAKQFIFDWVFAKKSWGKTWVAIPFRGQAWIGVQPWYEARHAKVEDKIREQGCYS